MKNEPGTEILWFSPSEELRTAEAAMMTNMQAMQGGWNAIGEEARGEPDLPSKEEVRVDSASSRSAFVAGLFYLITFAAAIAAVFLLGPVLNHADYIVSAGADTRVLWGCFFDLVNAGACIGTAVVLFPVVRRQNEAVALGFVTSRMLEAAIIVIGVVSLLAVVTLRRDSPVIRNRQHGLPFWTGRALVAVRDWTFLLGARAHARHQRPAAG